MLRLGFATIAACVVHAAAAFSLGRFDVAPWPAALAEPTRRPAPAFGGAAFVGGDGAGSGVWLVPAALRVAARVPTSAGGGGASGSNASAGGWGLHDGWPADLGVNAPAFVGTPTYDGASLWLPPFHAAFVASVDVGTGRIGGADRWPGAVRSGAANDGPLPPAAFWGSAFDGRSVMLAPHDAAFPVRVATDGSAALTAVVPWPAGFEKGAAAFAGAAFTGAAVVLAPFRAALPVWRWRRARRPCSSLGLAAPRGRRPALSSRLRRHHLRQRQPTAGCSSRAHSTASTAGSSPRRRPRSCACTRSPAPRPCSRTGRAAPLRKRRDGAGHPRPPPTPAAAPAAAERRGGGGRAPRATPPLPSAARSAAGPCWSPAGPRCGCRRSTRRPCCASPSSTAR